MSFLKSIKGTLTAVQKDITKSFKSLKKSDDKNDIRRLHLDGEINSEAGADLLHIYEESWAEIHNSIDQSAKRAKNVDIDISELCVYYERRTEALNEFNIALASLPQLTQEVKDVILKMSALEEDFITIENMLLILEDVCEQQELQHNKLKHTSQLEVYQHQKTIEVEQAKIEMAKAHAKKVQIHETKLQESLREKQRALEDTHHYEEELQKYKISGETKLKPQPSISSSEADLADISVEEDNAALEEFLEQSTEETDANKTDKEKLDNDVPKSPSSPTDESEDNDEFENAKDDVEPISVTPDEDIKQEDLLNANCSQSKSEDSSKTVVSEQ